MSELKRQLETPAWRGFAKRTQETAFDLASLRNTQHVTSRRLRNGLPELQRQVPAESGLWSSETIHKAWGIKPSAHALYGSPLDWGFDLTEPQITRALSHFLSPENFGDRGTARAIAFLTALCKVGGNEQLAERLEKLGPDVRLTVVPEHTVPGDKKRKGAIDLLFRLHDQDERIAIVVELKLGHVVTAGQLPNYRNYIIHSENYDLDKSGFFVVGQKYTSKDRKADSRNKDWTFVRWAGLFRRFEINLSLGCPDDDDEEFRRFRRTAWLRCARI